MRLAIYIALVLLAGALLSPLLFSAAQAFVGYSPESATGKLLASKEFPSYFSRAAMLAAFAGLAPLLKSLKLNWRSVVGTAPWRQGGGHLVAGLVMAWMGIAIMAWICFEAGACRFKSVPRWNEWLMPLVSGLSVSTIEEFLFRGAILGILCHSLGNRKGLYWTTVVFAVLHFLKPPADGALPDDQVTWWSGFWVLTQLFRGFGQWNNFVGEFMLLFVVGWVLAQARRKSDGLWLGIGLHAGWVAGMKYFGGLINLTPDLRAGELAPWMVLNTCRAIVSPVVGIMPVVVVWLTGLAAVWLVSRFWSARSEKDVASTPN